MVQNIGSRKISFSVAANAAWAPGLETHDDWLHWASGNKILLPDTDAPLKMMHPMLRRRASRVGRMALEAAYLCIPADKNIPTIFASRHGERHRSVELLHELTQHGTVGPTPFSLSVHNATGGLFAIARQDHANNIALSAGSSTVEHAIIEACGLLADGEERVLLVCYDAPPPDILHAFQTAPEQPYAWAWLMVPAQENNAITLSWSDHPPSAETDTLSPGLAVYQFFLASHDTLNRIDGNRCWHWNRHA